MASRKQLWHPDEVKKKIQASQLINRLNEHIYSAKPLMEQSQVTAALKLLGKVVPDLSAVQHSGDQDNPVAIVAPIINLTGRPEVMADRQKTMQAAHDAAKKNGHSNGHANGHAAQKGNGHG